MLLFQWQIKIEDDHHNFSIDEKLYKNILVYTISYKTLIGVTPLRFRFNKIDGFTTVCNGTRYLVLL